MSFSSLSMLNNKPMVNSIYTMGGRGELSFNNLGWADSAAGGDVLKFWTANNNFVIGYVFSALRRLDPGQ